MYGDKIRVSHGFDGCQMLEYIEAGINAGHHRDLKPQGFWDLVNAKVIISNGQGYFNWNQQEFENTTLI